MPNILAVVAFDNEAVAIEGGAGKRGLDITFHEFSVWFLETVIRVRQKVLQQGRFVSGYKCSAKPVVLPRPDIIFQLCLTYVGAQVRGHSIGIVQGCVPTLCSAWGGARPRSGDRRCSAITGVSPGVPHVPRIVGHGPGFPAGWPGSRAE